MRSAVAVLVWVLAAGLACASGGPRELPEDKAEGEGRVRVIATLDVAPLPAGREPSDRELETQRRAIEARRTSLTARLAGCDCQLEEGPAYTPIAVLEVDAAGLRVLRDAPEVVSVREDRAQEPTR